GDQGTVGERMDRVRAVPRLQARDPMRDLLDQSDREPPRTVPTRDASTGTLPERASRDEMPLPCRAQPRPDRQGCRAMDEPLEACTQRLRAHVRRTHLSDRPMTNARPVTPKSGQSHATPRSAPQY